VAAITAGAIFVASYLISPVTGVRVEGNRMFPAADAWEAIPDHASLLTLNTKSVEREIESNLWVEGTEVTKNWDSGIVTVQVEERSAVMDAELAGRRAIFALDGTELPGLGGASLESVRLDGDQLEDILKSGKVLRDNGVSLDSIDAVDAGGIRATVEGRSVVFGGVVRAGQARALPGVMDRHPDAPLFDLRSPERIVVGERNG